MKQWAIKTPRRKLIKGSTENSGDDAWDSAALYSKRLAAMFSIPKHFGNYIREAKSKGYRCVRVNVTEVE